MIDQSRRDMLGTMIGVVGATATAATATKSSGATEQSRDALADAVARRLSDLSAWIRTSKTLAPALRQLFDGGAVVHAPIGRGSFIVLRDPIRAVALLGVRHRDAIVDIPIVASFVGDASNLRLVSLEQGPSDLSDMLRSPAGPRDSDSARDTLDLQKRYDRLAAAGGGVLSIPAGRFATNLILHSRNVHLSGAGRAATRLVPRDPAQPVLRALYRDGSWDYVTVANLDIAGENGREVGFSAGADSYVAGDEFAGRTRFVNVGFADLHIAIRRGAGQIGLMLDQCGFGAADFHLHSTGNASGQGEIMHAGVFTARDCHFTGARIAVAHFDSPTEGSGAILFDNCIMERNPGFVFHVVAFGNVDATTDFVVRDCWNERNATVASVTIDQRSEAVRYAFFRKTGMVRFQGTPLGSLTLRNAVVATYGCALDNLSSVDRDAASTLTHHDARGFGSYAPIGMSLGIAAAAQSDPPGRALSFVIPNRTKVSPMPRQMVLLSSRGDEPSVLVGSVSVATQSAAEAILPGVAVSQRVILRRGMEVFPAPVAIGKGAWIAWLFTYRLVSGDGPVFHVSGDRGISAGRQLQSPTWETLGGMAQVAPGAREISLWMIQHGDAAEVLLGGYNLLTFQNRQNALDFLNSGSFVTVSD